MTSVLNADRRNAMQAAATQGAIIIKTYDKWFADLTDRHRAIEPVKGLKTAGWLMGHLVVTGDYARWLCGLPGIAPKDWRSHFGPGTIPSVDASVYPPMPELVGTFRSVYGDLIANAPNVPAETLSAENPLERARARFPTAGEFAEYLLTGHLGYHLGQLSMWRAAAAANGHLNP